MVSLVIPARNERFLQQTVTSLLSNARGEIEVIVVLDGYWPDPPLEGDDRLTILHSGVSKGMRPAINAAVAVAKGDYIMKIDAHCMVDEGYDVKLAADCEDNWVVIPRRKRLDAENWCIQDVGKPDIDHEYLCYPDNPADFGGAGLNGKIWPERTRARMDVLIDDNMSFQGSCWFMKKSYFYELELMDHENYGEFWNEAQEIGLKCWLSGGRVVTNKKTWYAHLHKGKKYGRGYRLDGSWLTKGATYTKKWLTFGEAWHKQTKPLEWLVDHFWPVPTWPERPTVPNVEKGKDVNTMQYIVDKYKLDVNNKIVEIPNMGRDDLAKLFAELGFRQGLEMGVEQGVYSEILCKANPAMTLYSVDAWAAYQGYREHVGQDKLDGFYAAVIKKMEPYKCNVIKGFSMDVVKNFKDDFLDFVYIDGNHDYKSTVEDIVEWAKKVRSGGIVAGHDYIHKPNMKFGVIEAVQGYVSVYGIRPLFIVGRKDKIDGEVRDRSRSWFFIKP